MIQDLHSHTSYSFCGADVSESIQERQRQTGIWTSGCLPSD